MALVVMAGLMSLAPLAWGASHRSIPKGSLVSRTRDFYGVLTVWQMDEGEGKGTMLHHGSITHGHQYSRRSLRTIPTTYYHDESGVGFALRAKDSPLPRPRRVGAIGLGGGTVAAYAQRGDVYRFYEISPEVERIAKTNFTYLSDAADRGATVDVVLGDGRLSMAAERDDDATRYDCLVLDAFSGDAIPTHLLTTEAFEMYKRRLSPHGVICVHVSNRYLDLEAVVATAARQLGWRAALFDADWTEAMRYPASWVVLAPIPRSSSSSSSTAKASCSSAGPFHAVDRRARQRARNPQAVTQAYDSNSVAETEAAGRARQTLRGGECVALHGDLGAGKTQFVRGLVRGLGGNPARSPAPRSSCSTSYEGGRLTVYHLDAYRVGGPTTSKPSASPNCSNNPMRWSSSMGRTR
jgi:SAM-dependent methyltransferase